MKNALKKAISILLVAVMVFGAAPLAGFVGLDLPVLNYFSTKAKAATITAYEVGDIIEFGSYPQTEVIDSNIIANLNDVDSEWLSYGYYRGTGAWADGKMIVDDYMRYTDVIYGSDKYRGVVFDTYRPYYTGYETLTTHSNTHQYDNGYKTETVYWFKYEPIKWRVLDPVTGLVMAEDILDSQPYNQFVISGIDEHGNGVYWGDLSKTYYINNYANSSIREWLNNDFYNTAFSVTQQNIIENTALVNSAYNNSYPAFNSKMTYDKIYLLSWEDVLNTKHGFSSSAGNDNKRIAQGSDYAKCQGLYVNTNNSGNSYWYLRSAGRYSEDICRILNDGSINLNYSHASITYHGVRPALNLNLRKSYHIVDQEFDKNLDYYAHYLNSSEYNPELANMLAALSKAVYSEGDIERACHSLGFNSMDLFDYDIGFHPSTCGYSLAFKKSEFSEDILCLVSVRGTNNFSDLYSDFVIATFEDEKHDGFAYPANRIYETIQNSIDINNFTGNIKYILTGHSRGAAVANLLAVKLMENGIAPSNIFNYNFACPDVACKKSFPNYDNIFNLCNREDIVPFVPGNLASIFTLPGTSWGKFGRTYWFTKKSNKIAPFADHDKSLYLEFFNQKLQLSEWGASVDDLIGDLKHFFVGYLVKILCPVDIIITGSDGKNIASVIDGEINYYDSDFGDVIIFTDGDKKVIYVDDDIDFNVNLIGTDNGEMTYSVEKYNIQADEVYDSKRFADVRLKKGKTMFSPVCEAEFTKDIELFVVENINEQNTYTHIVNEDGTEISLDCKITIKNNFGTKTINYGETLNLTAILTDKPANSNIVWYVDGVKKGEGETFNVSFESGTKTVEVKLVDVNGNVLKDASGNEFSDSESVTVKSGFFQKIISFFKNLFKIDRTVVQ